MDLGPDTFNCIGTPITLQSSVTYTAPTYLWSNGATTASVTTITPNTFWLRVTVAGCAAADTVNVAIISDTFHLSNNDTAICEGKSVHITLTANPAATFLWLPTTGVPQPFIASPVITPDTSALYRVAISIPGCPDLYDSLYIDVQPYPHVSLTGTGTVCEFDTLHLHAVVDPAWYPAYKFSWTPATYLDDSTASTVVFKAGDTSKLTVTVTSPAGCAGSDSILITTFPGNFASYDTSFRLCPHDSVQFTPSGGVSYTWHPALYLDDSLSATPWVHPITSQEYEAVAVSNHGCLDTVRARVVVHPGALLNLGDSVRLYPGESYHISPQTNCVSFSWLPHAGLSNGFVSDPIIAPLLSTKYVVHGITEWGCEITDSISIHVDPTSLLAIPNAFSPGTNVNSKLRIIKRGDAVLSYFRIFNRWGNMVFETTDIDEGWDGTYKGKPQPFGVYIYQVEAVEINTGAPFNKHGNVTLVR